MQHSEAIGALAAALAKARAEFHPVKKESENPYFKSSYADLATLIEATHEGLSKNGLAVIQSPGKLSEANRITVITILMHSSGEWLQDELEMPVSKPDAQGLGSAITYGRRYAYQAILNVAGDVDDDGNAAVGRTQKDRQSSSTDMSEKDGRTINPAMARAFWAAVTKGNKSRAEVLTFFGTQLGIEKTDEMLKKDHDKAMKWALKPSDDLTGIAAESLEHARKEKEIPTPF